MYSPTVWTDGVTPVNAANLTKLEAGVAQGGIPADTVVANNTHLLRNKFLAGDANPAFYLRGDGYQGWGPGGAGALDTQLYRSGVGQLQTESSFFLRGGVGTYLGLFANLTDPYSRLYIDSNGNMNWSAGTTPADTQLSRVGAGTLYSPTTLASGQDIIANRLTSTQIWLNPDGSIYFGAASDVKLYRTAAGELSVNGAFKVSGDFDPAVGRLGQICKQVADWNLALDNGWYMASPGLNAPASLTGWAQGTVVAHGAAGYRIQRVWDFTSQTDSQVWERRQQGGAWQPWVKAGFYGDGTGAMRSDSTVIANKFGVQLGTANQILIEADGRIYFGSASDSNLYRIAAGYLGTDQAFYAKDELCANYGVANQILLQANGYLSFGNGLDTHLYRSAAGVLKTGNVFRAGNDIVAHDGIATQVRIGNSSGLASIAFGSALDTIIYRTAAGVLKTDGQIEVGSTGVKFSDGSVQTKSARVISGQINAAAGSIAIGTGFSVVRNGTGQFTITFTTPFASPPAVVVSRIANGMGFVMVTATPLAGSFQVNVRGTGNGVEDGDFSFHASL